MAIHITNIERGVRADPLYPFLRRACGRWVDSMIDYHRRLLPANDWPFWYGERPLVGFLNAGMWQSGGVCIEEYQSDKKAEAAEGKKTTYLGRGDLYFSYAKREGYMEFKMNNVGISEADHFAAFLRRKWSIVKKDVTKGRQRGVESFGGMFLRPYVGKGNQASDISRYNANLRELLKVAWTTLDPAALAWWCPTKRVLKGERNTKDWVVGAILLVKKS